MSYGNVIVYRDGARLTIAIDLPERGEPSLTGRSENLVDPRTWTRLIQAGDQLDIKLAVCRPYRRSWITPRV